MLSVSLPAVVLCWFLVTAYAPGCGDSGLTATGTPPVYGTVAADWRVLPPGTRLVVQGLPGIFTVEDRGAGIIGNHIDIWLPSCAEAIQWGRRWCQLSLVVLHDASAHALESEPD